MIVSPDLVPYVLAFCMAGVFVGVVQILKTWKAGK